MKTEQVLKNVYICNCGMNHDSISECKECEDSHKSYKEGDVVVYRDSSSVWYGGLSTEREIVHFDSTGKLIENKLTGNGFSGFDWLIEKKDKQREWVHENRIKLTVKV